MIEIFVDFFFGMSLFVNALLFIPQMIKLRKLRNSKDFSKITFVGFCMMQALAICYGLIHHDRILMFGYGCSLMTCGYVTFLIFSYSKSTVGEHVYGKG
jgi:MtN3 and saliva related transmembrane protein